MRTASGENVVVVENLVKDYTVPLPPKPGFGQRLRRVFAPEKGIKRALKGINLTVPRGQVLGFVGPNGAGKTTTIKILTGIIAPTAGNVSVLGFNPHRQRYEYTYHIGLVFGQRSLLWYDIPVIDSLKLYAEVYEVSREAFRRRLTRFAEILGIDEFLHVPVKKLSLGQRMRAEIAASLLHDPEVLFLDEPTLGLDAVAKEEIRLFLTETNKERGTTIFLTTHNMGDIEALCDRVVIIDEGTIIYDGTTEDLRNLEHEKHIDVEFLPVPGSSPLATGEAVAKSLALIQQYGVDSSQLATGRGTEARGHSLLPRKVRLRVPQEQSLEVVSLLLALGTVRDLNVAPPSLDAIIRRIYKGGLGDIVA
ncbi:MAG TPA: ATP-binding cassette domain-containing protein [Firmicutes bacterium]|nr:ATP-binding cassette domain-containing protein [Candidatus Fermentithermobacillaceae bacterium]